MVCSYPKVLRKYPGSPRRPGGRVAGIIQTKRFKYSNQTPIIMKKLNLLTAALTAVLLAGCYGDEIDHLENDVTDITNRIEVLEKWMNETNENIASLQTIVEALQEKDYVTSVTPLADGSGYVIAFSQSGPVTIYHGEEGHTPQIDVKQDTDGAYYWTLDGQWMTDTGGNKIPTTGPEGTTPKMKIEEDYWYISYDNGDSWTRLDKASGDDGDSFFQGVAVAADGTSVTFTLTNGNTYTFPIYGVIGISAPEGTDLLDLTPGQSCTLALTIAESVTDYQLTAKIEAESKHFAMTRSTAVNRWEVTIDKEQATVTVVVPTKMGYYGGAQLTVTLVDNQGANHTVGKAMAVADLTGSGSAEDPYIVQTGKGLQEAGEKSSAHIRLAADIDLSDAPTDENGGNWTPLGGSYNYTGVFDGNGKSISGMQVKASGNKAGLVGYLYTGTIKNVTLIDCTVTSCSSESSHYAGGLAGQNVNGTISGCRISGNSTITASGGSSYNYAGGIVGYNNNANNMDGVIDDCRTEGTQVTASGKGSNHAGGIVGYNTASSGTGRTVINNCRAEQVQVIASGGKSTNRTGGIVAYNNGTNTGVAMVSGCRVGGNSTVTAAGSNSPSSGGIVGYNTATGTIGACHADGVHVTASGGKKNNYAGGIAGTNMGHANTKTIGCYAYQCTTGTGREALVGAANIAGKNGSGTVVACYFYAAGGVGENVTPVATDSEGNLSVGTAVVWGTASTGAVAAMNAQLTDLGWNWGGEAATATLTNTVAAE